jgi:hypothetical protein
MIKGFKLEALVKRYPIYKLSREEVDYVIDTAISNVKLLSEYDFETHIGIIMETYHPELLKLSRTYPCYDYWNDKLNIPAFLMLITEKEPGDFLIEDYFHYPVTPEMIDFQDYAEWGYPNSYDEYCDAIDYFDNFIKGKHTKLGWNKKQEALRGY